MSNALLSSTVAAALCAALCISACGSSSSTSTTSPTPTPTPVPATTRVISVTGSLNFGDVVAGSVRTDGILTIANTGNAALAVTSITGPCGTFFSLSFTNGTISAGASQTVSVRFAPTATATSQSCTGVLTVVGDQTAGTNTIAVTANVLAGFSKILSGLWRGTLSVDTTVNLTQSGTTLSGEYHAVNVTGSLSGSVSNTGGVTFTVTVSGFQPFTFSGTSDAAGNTISGQVNGSGFVNSAWTLKRQ